MNGTGPARREGFLDPEAVAAALRDPDSFDLTPVLAAAVEFFGPISGGMSRPLVIGPGDPVPDLMPAGSPAGFLLDIDPPDWRSEWGGLLLCQEGGDRLHGYRPVPGALTLYPASARPLISLITAQGRLRTSIFGWWF